MLISFLSKLMVLLILLSGGPSSCGKSKNKGDNSYGDKRTSVGVNRKLAKEKYIDYAPSLSGDGTIAYFISGRSETMGYSLYKIDTAGAGAVTEIVPASSGWSTIEAFQLAKNDGYLIGSGINAEKSDVFLLRLDTNQISKVTDDENFEFDLALDAESKFLAYRSISAADKTGQVLLRDINTSTFEVSAPSNIGEADQFGAGLTFAGEPTSLYLNSRLGDTYQSSISNISFTSRTEAETATPSTFSTNSSAVSGMIGSTANLFFNLKIAELFAPISNRTEAHSAESPVAKVRSSRETQAILISDKSNLSAANPNYAINASDPTANSGGSLAAWIETTYFSCDVLNEEGAIAETKTHFAKVIRLWDSSKLTGAAQYLLPVKAEGGGWKIVTSDYCSYVSNADLIKTVDWYVTDVAMNSAATNTSFSLAYVSSQTDVECVAGEKILGDSEIRVIQFAADAYTVKEVSSNQAAFAECETD